MNAPKDIYAILTKLENVKVIGKDKYQASCPVPGHGTADNHLSVTDAGDKALVKCFHLHSYADICKALGFDTLTYGKNGHKPITEARGEIVKVYDYPDASGKVIHQTVRYQPKRFSQRRSDGNGGWIWDLKGIETVLYRLPQVLAAIKAGDVVFLTEGEKDADSLCGMGFTATTNPMGAGKWKVSYSESLRDGDVVIIPDNDAPGLKHAENVAASLKGIARRVRTLRVPEGSKDITEWLENGGNQITFMDLLLATTEYVPPTGGGNGNGNGNGHRPDGGHFNLTDLGNAERLVAKYGAGIRYCYERQKWLIWNKRVWEWDSGPQIKALAKLVVRGIYNEAAEEPDEKERKILAEHARHSESDHKLTAMINLAQSEKGIPAPIEGLDANAWLLNVKNGTVDLKTGELLPHNPADLNTKIVMIDYDPESTSSMWDTFLKRIFEGKTDLIAFVQRALGYSITGDQGEQAFFFCHGGGSNGKSTLLGAVQDVVGPYAHEVEPQAFMVGRSQSGGPNESIANLQKIRFAPSTELDDGQRLSTALIKRMTGGERLHCERKYEHGYDFLPEYKLWLSGNHEPMITDTTNSIWRRLYKIPFLANIPKTEIIKNYRKVLSHEHGQAILAWLVKGCLEWQKVGLAPPKDVIAATQAYRDSQDVLFEFLAESCVIQTGATVYMADVYKAYRAWCEENDEKHPLGKMTFNSRLQEKGFTKGAGNANKKIWYGLYLKDAPYQTASGELEF